MKKIKFMAVMMGRGRAYFAPGGLEDFSKEELNEYDWCRPLSCRR